MVLYYGRQKLLTSTLNTNQIGLKMSGTAPSVGSSISTRRLVKRRVRDNLKFCGPVYYHGQLWSYNSGDRCVEKAPKNQSLAGGVGRINNPRTKCNIKCSVIEDYDGDGIPNSEDADADGDLVPHIADNDDNNNGIPDYEEDSNLLLPTINNKDDLKSALVSWISRKSVYQHPNNWDTSKVTDMSNLFNDASFIYINVDISNWDTSNVTNMRNMFSRMKYFNGDISNWDTSNVTNMSYMFNGAEQFNGDISNWDTSSVTYMSYMFIGAEQFNGDISNWDTSSVTDMRNMFSQTRRFNRNIRNWDTSNVTNMSYMFSGAKEFNQDISGWNVSNVVDMTNMFQEAYLVLRYPKLPEDPKKDEWNSYWD